MYGHILTGWIIIKLRSNLPLLGKPQTFFDKLRVSNGTDSADVWALLDPAGLWEVNALFLQLNRSQTNVLDLLTRRGAGKYYAFSGLSTFLGLHAVAALEGPVYTSSLVANRSIATWMDEISSQYTSSLSLDLHTHNDLND